jgi:hypothetical protein
VNKADALMDIIRALMVAVREEDFNAVIEKSQELSEKWSEVQSQERKWEWRGLETLLHHHYRSLDQDAKKPKDHQEAAEKQKHNLEIWKRHALNVNEIYEELREIEAQLDGGLDRLKLKMSLSEIIENCKLWETRSERFLSIVKKEMPEPQSQKAEREKLSIKASERIAAIEDVPGTRTRVVELRETAQEILEDFEEEGAPLYELLRFVSSIRRLPSLRSQHIATAREKLRACEEIDPRHEKVLQYREKLDELEERVNAGASQKQGRWPWS